MTEQKLLATFYLSREQVPVLEVYKEYITSGWRIVSFEIEKGAFGGIYIVALLERMLINVKS